MIVVVGNTKGGVGKTTLALNLAVSRAIAGRDVWLVDGDRQQTASTAISVRSESGKSPAISCAAYCDGPMLRAQVQQQKHKFDDIVIDVGGRDSTALRAALSIADVLVVPFLPRSYDVWALNDIAQLVKEANSIRDGLRTYAVINGADPAGSDNREAASAVSNHPELNYLDAQIGRRKAFSNAAGSGFGVQELNPVDPKAALEISRLVEHIYNEK